MLKAIAAFVGLLALGFVALLAAFVWWSSSGVFSTSKFNATEWFAKQTNETEVTCYRGGMANDIKNRLLNPGMSTIEVERLLGEPDFKASAEYRYVLGMCSGIGWDYDDLHVYFDNHGKLVRAAIIQH